jgi:hypothetical protein
MASGLASYVVLQFGISIDGNENQTTIFRVFALFPLFGLSSLPERLADDDRGTNPILT